MALVRLTIRVRPGAARTRVAGEYDGALMVAVTARAAEGRATEAALGALAAALGVRRGNVTLVTGAASRTKIVEIEADGQTAELISQRAAQLRGQPGR